MTSAGSIWKRAILAVAAAIWLAGAAAGMAEEDIAAPEPSQPPSTLTERLAEVIGDSTVISSFVVHDGTLGKDVSPVPWEHYELATPQSERWSLRISGPLDSEAEARNKFYRTSMIASVRPNEWNDGDGYEMQGWNRPEGKFHHVFFRRGTSMGSVDGDLPYELAKDKAATLDRLLRGGTLSRQVAEAAWASEATIYLRQHPAPTPTPAPTARTDVRAFLRGDPAAQPYWRALLRRPVLGPLSDESGKVAAARRDAVVNLADLAKPSTLPLLKRLAANGNEYLSVRVLAIAAALEVEMHE